MAQQLTQAVVEQWVALTHGRITNRDAWAELDIGTPEGRSHLRKIMRRLVDAGILRALADGNYQRVNGACPIIDWQAGEPPKVVSLLLTFLPEESFALYP